MFWMRESNGLNQPNHLPWLWKDLLLLPSLPDHCHPNLYNRYMNRSSPCSWHQRPCHNIGLILKPRHQKEDFLPSAHSWEYDRTNRILLCFCFFSKAEVSPQDLPWHLLQLCTRETGWHHSSRRCSGRHACLPNTQQIQQLPPSLQNLTHCSSWSATFSIYLHLEILLCLFQKWLLFVVLNTKNFENAATTQRPPN